MSTITINNVRIAGLAAMVPRVEELTWEQLGSTSERCENARRWKKTPFRRVAKPEHCQSDYCIEASKRLLADLGWQVGEIEAVVMATLTPDFAIPATSIIVQDRLGVPKAAVAFDLPSGSIGFLHGLQSAASMLSTGFLKKALLMTGKVCKTPETRDCNAPHREIPGDSGCVCALEFSEGSPAMVFESGGDGSAHAAFCLPVGGGRNPAAPAMFATPEGTRAAREFTRDYAVREAIGRQELPASARRALDAAGKGIADIDGCYFVPMTLPIEERFRREFEIPRDRFHANLPEFGIADQGSFRWR